MLEERDVSCILDDLVGEAACELCTAVCYLALGGDGEAGRGGEVEAARCYWESSFSSLQKRTARSTVALATDICSAVATRALLR